MRASRQRNKVTLTFASSERHPFRRILETIIRNYGAKPNEVERRVASVWYSTRGCETAEMSPEEIAEWIAELHGLKASRLRLLRKCVRHLTGHQTGERELRLDLDQTETLMAALNDHRLFLAAKHGIGNDEIGLPLLAAMPLLNPSQRRALLEICLLAEVIEALLRLIAPEAANWMD